MSEPTVDRNLLFGLLALQMDFISREGLIAGMQAWVFDKSKPLAQILLEQGQLTPERVQRLDPLVQEHLQAHQHDSQRSLAALGSFRAAREDLRTVNDSDLQAFLDVAGQPPTFQPASTAPSPKPAASGLQTGLRLRIVRPHARGGLGEVSVALDQDLHREVALKEIQACHAHDPDNRARFLWEAEITGGLEHPGIVPVYGLGRHADGRPFYVMRFIKGENLQTAIDRFHEADRPDRDPSERGLAFRQLLGRFVDVCHAIAYAHNRGILHRDLKPGNVMLGNYGETLVVDWGLAKSVGQPTGAPLQDETPFQPRSGSRVAATQMGMILGTPAYMSPEQAEGRLDLLGPASDIYSLGATLYTLLTAQPPVEGESVAEVLRKVQQGIIVPPQQVRPKTPVALAAICLKALARQREDRYATAQELAADIERWLADEPVRAWPEPWWVRLRRWLKRHRTTVTAAMAAASMALVSLLVLLIVLSTANQRLREANARAEANFQEAQRQEGEAQQAAQRERAAKETAQANYQLARESVEQYLTKVADSPQLKVSGLRSLRRQLLEQASKFYSRFIQERGQESGLQADLAGAYAKSAYIAQELGAYAEASKRYQQAETLFAQLAAAHPEVPQYQSDRARTSNNLGVLYQLTGQPQAALQSFQRAQTLREKLVDAHPDIPQYQSELASTYNNLGLLHQATRQRDAAWKYHEQARTLQEKLTTAHPEVAQYQRELALTYNHLGILHRGTGQREAARKSYEQARTLQAKLVAHHPDVPEYQLELAGTHDNLGIVQQVSGQPEAAARSHQQAQALLEKLVAAHPDVPQYQIELAGAYVNLGHLVRNTGQPADSLTWYAKAIPLLEAVRQREPDHRPGRQFLRNAHGGRAQALARLGRHDEALGAWDRTLQLESDPARAWARLQRALSLAHLGQHVQATAEANQMIQGQDVPGSTWYDAACIYSLSSAAARQDAQLLPADRTSLAEQYAARAVERLTKAKAAGHFKDQARVEELKKDTDLDPLRAREDFKKLVGELEKAAGK